MTKPASRLITLIMLLQNRPTRKPPTWPVSWGVSVRTCTATFRRWMTWVSPSMPNADRYGGFSLVRGYKMPPLVFHRKEAVAVSLGSGLVEDLWGDLYRQAARSALAKLESMLPEQATRRGQLGPALPGYLRDV